MKFLTGKKVKFVYAHDMWPISVMKLVGEVGEVKEKTEFDEAFWSPKYGSRTRRVVLWLVEFGGDGGLKVWMREKYLEVIDA